MKKHRARMSEEKRKALKEKDRKRKAKSRMEEREKAGIEVKTRKSKYECKKKVSKLSYAKMEEEHTKMTLWYKEVIKIAKDSIAALHAIDDWKNQLP